MREDAINRLTELFKVNPATVDEYRQIVRALVAGLHSLSPPEAEIFDWDKEGRDPDQFDRIRSIAWAFPETGKAAYRARLFAGFVTSQERLDGYGAEYLIDYALASGVAEEDVLKALLSRGRC